ncbi:MAG: hypothetical protein ACJ8AT_21950 [Hyalangium sp.]|uniref:hypothetical protein n=1 Tax=Hyalangium sp. TaxID=2028555 RepID=UPI00389AA6BE
MSFFSSIGNVLKSVGSVASKVSSVAGKVADIGGKILQVAQKPLGELTAPLKKLAGGFLDKLPFGLGNFVKPFAEKLIDSGASFLSKNVLGATGLLGKATKTVGDVTKLAEGIKGVADKVGAFANNPLGQGNFQQLIAQAHAAHIF